MVGVYGPPLSDRLGEILQGLADFFEMFHQLLVGIFGLFFVGIQAYRTTTPLIGGRDLNGAITSGR